MRRVLQSNSDFMNNDLILVVTLCPHGNLKVIVKMNFLEFKVIRELGNYHHPILKGLLVYKISWLVRKFDNSSWDKQVKHKFKSLKNIFSFNYLLFNFSTGTSNGPRKIARF